MFKINNWKQPLYKNDIINVLLNGFIFSVLGGILAGLLDFLFAEILSFPVSFSLIVICYMLGIRMRRGYCNYHILYPVLSLAFMLLALVFSEFAYMFCIFPEVSTLRLLLKGSFYLNVILNPIHYILLCIKNFQILYLILGIFNLIFYIFAFLFCYRLVKGRN